MVEWLPSKQSVKGSSPLPGKKDGAVAEWLSRWIVNPCFGIIGSSPIGLIKENFFV